jgi:hypothetical protein
MKKIIEAALRAAIEKASQGDVFSDQRVVDTLVAEASTQLVAALAAEQATQAANRKAALLAALSEFVDGVHYDAAVRQTLPWRKDGEHVAELQKLLD